ncbi:ribonuclease H-like domain-containing protein [Tanacetum coccineum]
MRPFKCPVTILNTIDHLGKFDGKTDEGFFVGYYLNSKAFRVFNSKTWIVEENLHIRFSESTPNAVGSGPDWLFDIDALTRTMNYEPIVAGTQSNGFAGTKASDNAGQARKETEPVKDYILLPLWTADPPFSQDPKSSYDDGSKPSSDDGKKVDEDPRKDSECNDQEKEDNVNSTNNVNVAGINEVNVVGGKISIELPFDPNMPALEDYSIFDFSRDDEDDGAVADMNNLDTTIQVSPIPTTRIHKDHPLDQVIGDLQSATQTRKMSKNLKEHGFVRRTQNREMNQFCKMKGILRQFSVARTPQQNGVAERRNRTLIEAARTMLADSKLPTTFWAEAVNTACYVQNRVLVVKPHNKTPYELFHGRTPTLSFMRPFGCPVTILNTIDHLGKFDGKADEGFFVGYSLNSKAFRVFNSRTRIVEENLHIRFSESTPNVVGSGPDWLFDIDALTRTMNYEPIVAGTQSNGFAGTKASDNAGQARKETEPVKDYILLPLWTADPPYSQDPKSSHDDGSKPSSDDGKKVDEDPRKDSECKDQEKEDNVNNTNTVNAAGTNEVNAVGGKTSIELSFDPNMPALKDYSIFDFLKNDKDDGAKADMNNLDTTI